MKKILVVVSDEAYEVLKRYQDGNDIANLDTALDTLLKELEEDTG